MMFARIGVMRALNRQVEQFNPSRQDPHWSRRKLKRDRRRMVLRLRFAVPAGALIALRFQTRPVPRSTLS
jgi:hypothetical protein